MATVNGIGGSNGYLDGVVGTNTDENIEALMKSGNKVETDLRAQFKKLDDPNLKESEKQEILWKIQGMQNLLERIYSLISSMLESAHRTMMGVIQKIGG
jgi:hypothetical protein